MATIDEWLSGDIREDVVGAIEQGASKVDDYLIVATSSEGTIRNGSGDTIKMELMDILKGDYPIHMFLFGGINSIRSMKSLIPNVAEG